MAELPYQTWERVTGKGWNEAKSGGFTSGSAAENIALQSRLNSGWNPFGSNDPVVTASGSSEKPEWLKNDPFAGEFERAIQEQNKAREELLARQKAEEEGLFGDFEKKLAGQEKLTDAYGRLKSEAGIPDLQKQVDVYKGEIYKVKDLLDRLDEDITARTKGTFTSESQRNRQVAAEGDPLRTSLSRLGTAATPFMERLSSAMSEVGTMLGLTREEQAKELEPLKLRINASTDRFAREISGFEKGKESELTGLLDKITRGRELADREWQRLETLAQEEREFARQKELMAQQFEYDMKKAKASGSGTDALSNILAKYANAGGTTTDNDAKTSALNAISGYSAPHPQEPSVFSKWWNSAKSWVGGLFGGGQGSGGGGGW
jgi:hypothetical protein